MKNYTFPTCDLVRLSPSDVLTTSTLENRYSEIGETLNRISWNDIENKN